MKPFTKRLALVMGLLFTALICMGIVYIDNVKHYWKVEADADGLMVNLYVNTNFIASIDTNTLALSFLTTNHTRAFSVQAKPLPDNWDEASGTDGSILLFSARGPNFTNTTEATALNGGGFTLSAGVGGAAPNAITNAIGGDGGQTGFTGGAGGAGATVATNSSTGGNGSAFNVSGGNGGSPSGVPSTNGVGGNGGAVILNGGLPGTPTVGWSRKGGAGGGVTLNGRNGGNSVRTNSGAGGGIAITAGNSGNVTTTPGSAGIPGNATLTAGNSGSAVAGGNPSPGGNASVTAGNGSTGTTNSDGGHVFIAGGAPGSGAVPGNVVVGRTSAGTSRGGLQVGPIVTGTTATLTNLLTITAVLDFGSIVAGTVADLPVAFAGAAAGDVVTVAVPLESVTNCMWMAFASNAVVYVRAANTQLVSAQDPNSGTFRIKLEKYR